MCLQSWADCTEAGPAVLSAWLANPAVCVMNVLVRALYVTHCSDLCLQERLLSALKQVQLPSLLGIATRAVCV
jgi:hypothetical protein